MAFFELTSEITIGKFKFVGVHDVRIRRSIFSYADMAWIKLPTIAVVQKGNVVQEPVGAGTLFADGDAVEIKLGYNGELKSEFKGFVKRWNADMPMEIECEGYVRKLRQDIDVVKPKGDTTASGLLNLTKTDKNGKPTGIKVVVANDLPFINVRLPHVNGIELCDAVKRFSERTLNVFFIEPDTLWCGLVYTAISKSTDPKDTTGPFKLGVVDYKIGWNVVRDGGLKDRTTSNERVQILFNGSTAAGLKVMAESDDKVARHKHRAILNHVGSETVMKQMANERQYQVNYTGYEGRIHAFLQPFCLPGWVANISDPLYPAKSGRYLIVSTEVRFGARGARRIVEIGPLLGFKPVK